MILGIVSGQRYERIGQDYYTTSQFDAEMWSECLEAFDEVLLAFRIVQKDKIAESHRPVLTKGVRLIEVPNSSGFLGSLFIIPRLLWFSSKIARQANIWHLHTPNITAICLWFWLWIYNIPYSIELRGDQSINPDYLRLRGFVFSKLIASIMRFFLKLQMTRPVAVVSVARFLTKITPPKNNCPIHYVSNARISPHLFSPPKVWESNKSCYTIVCSGRCEAQKNPLGTLHSLAHLNRKGFTKWKFIWIGDGPLLEKSKQLSRILGITEQVSFIGFVPWENIFPILRNSDIFILNSVAEGLPRAILEAMAVSLPVVSTRCGAWDEILDPEVVVNPLDPMELSDKIFEVLTSPDRLSKMSLQNNIRIQDFSSIVLKSRKIAFYRELRTKIDLQARTTPCPS